MRKRFVFVVEYKRGDEADLHSWRIIYRKYIFQEICIGRTVFNSVLFLTI